jgi:hypothetical protein
VQHLEPSGTLIFIEGLRLPSRKYKAGQQNGKGCGELPAAKGSIQDGHCAQLSPVERVQFKIGVPEV